MSRADVKNDVERATGEPLVHPVDGPYDGMLYVGPLGPTASLALHLDETDLLNDEVGMPFSTHPYQIDVRPGTLDHVELQLLADEIYDSLRQTRHYSMFSTFDVQRVLRRDLID